MWRVLAIAIALTGCISDRLVDCEGGYACPQGLVCDVAHEGCVAQDQFDACAGSADGTDCTAGPIAGTCNADVCLAPGCGNRVIDPGEQCDDGNHVSGDGCSADCKSTEVCGNGYTDVDLGEQCDDGNLISHDGCDSRCQTETEVWTAIPLAIVNSQASGVAFDAHRSVLVYGTTDATWEWDGTTWTIPSFIAPFDSWLAVVYDSDSELIVGIGASSMQLSAASWDGTAWTLLAPLTGNSPTTVKAAAYDSARHAIFVVDDAGGAYYLDTTTATWTQVANSPYTLSAPRIAFDAGRQRDVVLDTGNLTYEFDGTMWTAVASVPRATSAWGMTYDGTRNAVVAIGGTIAPGLDDGEIYSWDGTAWSNTGAAIPAYSGVAAWYDARDGSLGVFGGTSTTPSAEVGEVLSVSGTQIVDHTEPMPQRSGGMYYDSVRARIVIQLPSLTQATWIYDGTSWQSVSSAQAPKEVDTAVFDPVRGGLVAIDGTDGSTWLLTDQWQQLSFITGVVANGALGTYDYANRRVVVIQGNLLVLDSNGTGWSALTGADLSGGLSVTYDPATEDIVAMASGGLEDLVDNAWQVGVGPPPSYGIVGSFARGSLLMSPTGSKASRDIFERRHGAVTTFTQTPISLVNAVTVHSSSAIETADGSLVFQIGSQTAWLLVHSFTSADPDETCVPGEDADGDGLEDCADPDCWQTCWPACPFATSCP